MEENENKGVISGKQLNVGETIKQTIYVYKTGLKQFMILSLLTMITYLGMIAVQVVVLFSLTAAILIFIVSLASVYVSIRANAGMILLTKNILQGESRTGKESYRQTKDLAGTYFAIALMYGLILILPCLGIWISYEFISNNVIKYGIIGLLMIPMAFLSARYYLAIPSALLIGESGGLQSSMLLVKGDFWQVLSVLILTQGIFFSISQVFAKLAELYTAPQPIILIAVAQVVFLILTGPINGIASTIMYLTLNRIKGIDVNLSESADLIENSQE